MIITLEPDDRIEVDGVKLTGIVIKEALNNPPTRYLFSVKREGEHLVFTSYGGKEAACKFYDELPPECS